MTGNQKRDVKKYFFMLPNAVFELGLHVYELAIYAYLLRIEDRRTWQCAVSYTHLVQGKLPDKLPGLVQRLNCHPRAGCCPRGQKYTKLLAGLLGQLF